MRTSTKVLLIILVVASANLARILYLDDPLRIMERTAFAQLAVAGHADLPTDEKFYQSAQTLEYIVEHNLGATVAYGETDIRGALGTTDPRSREVTIDQTLHWTARFETLAHEAGHLLSPPGLTTYGDREAFAEAVGGLTSFYNGDSEALTRSGHYLATVKTSLHVLSDYRSDIIRAAQFLSGRSF